MNTRFMNPENLHRLGLNLSDKVHLKRSGKYITLTNRIIYNT